MAEALLSVLATFGGFFVAFSLGFALKTLYEMFVSEPLERAERRLGLHIESISKLFGSLSLRVEELEKYKKDCRV